MPKIYHAYILRELAESFVLAFGAYTFVMMLGALFQPLQAGLGMVAVARMLPSGLPTLLPWTVPISVLTACVIAYGRLSSDNEVIAMNVLGLHPCHVIAPGLLLGAAMLGPMLYCNHFFEPRSHQVRRMALQEAGLTRPFSLLALDEPVFQAGDWKIYIAEANENRLKNVIVYRRVAGKDKNVRETEVTYAATAVYDIVGSGTGRVLRLTLRNSEVKHYSQDAELYYDHASTETKSLSIPLGDRAFIPGWKDMTTPELHGALRSQVGPTGKPIERERLNDLLTRLRMRWSTSFAPLSLALLGVPLGILTRKGRKLVGFGVSVLVVVAIYFPLVVCGKAMSNNGRFPAPLWPWASVIVVAVIGAVLTRRQFKV